jgi:endoglucanase
MKLFKETAKRGILLLIDLHCVDSNGYLDPLWYNSNYNEDDFVNAWFKMIDLINDEPNLLGIELFNEPKPPSTWGGGSDVDWRRMAIKLVEKIYYNRPNFDKLIFIEGISWGRSFGDFSTYPLDFRYLSTEVDNRVVLAPHTYGPSVYDDPLWNNNPDFPGNMPGDWNKDIGLYESAMLRPSVLTEWGGTFLDKDREWQETLGNYLIDRCIEDNFYWGLTADSKDTGGILYSDYYSPHYDKLALLKHVQQYPTIFTKEIKNDNICFIEGHHVNPQC